MCFNVLAEWLVVRFECWINARRMAVMVLVLRPPARVQPAKTAWWVYWSDCNTDRETELNTNFTWAQEVTWTHLKLFRGEENVKTNDSHVLSSLTPINEDLTRTRTFEETKEQESLETWCWRVEVSRTISLNFIRNLNLTFLISFLPDNFYKVEGAKDALICGNGSDAGWVLVFSSRVRCFGCIEKLKCGSATKLVIWGILAFKFRS